MSFVSFSLAVSFIILASELIKCGSREVHKLLTKNAKTRYENLKERPTATLKKRGRGDLFVRLS